MVGLYYNSGSYFQTDGETTITSIISAFNTITLGAMMISALSIAVFILWDAVLTKKHKLFQLIEGSIVVVMRAIAMNTLFQSDVLNFILSAGHLVRLPFRIIQQSFSANLRFPIFLQ
ncbi:MAG: hypothetical protein M3P47_06980 [Pseudomonadota bacterium]|nr:hypothetical protein [Pseudomonadota bacterium]